MAGLRYSLSIDRAALQAVGMQGAHRSLSRVIRRTLTRSAVLCPVDTGRLRASGKMNLSERGRSLRGSVTYDANYAAAVHDGRAGVIIRPRRRKALRFMIGDRVVFARQVWQPPRPGRPFLLTALREVAGSEGYSVTVGKGS